MGINKNNLDILALAVSESVHTLSSQVHFCMSEAQSQALDYILAELQCKERHQD